MKFLTAERGGVAARIAAAVGGGYALATVMSVFVARVLPVARPTAVMTGMLLSFLFYACAGLWVFAAGTARRAWLGLLLPTVTFALLAWWLGPAAVPSVP